ncbi:MAG: beta-ketoacyl synthase N-terminal-like domain-containing protein [Planctomycetota bacterium]|nr:beta-ketoacyl synthase N-terminal-like domain-containing protein [Planctomycetota bacterium]
MPPSTPRTILITGLGTVSALGSGIDVLWQGLLEGRSGLGPIHRIDATGFRSSLGGDVPDFTAKTLVPKHYRKAVKVMARDTELAVGAALFAVQDANLETRATTDDNPTYSPSRTGCHIGAGLIAAETDELAPAIATATDESGAFRERLWGTNTDAGGNAGMNNLPPLWLLKYLPNMLACHVTILHGCEGPSNTITCAEASGLLSLGESLRVIQRDDADCCFAGGTESKLNLMGFARLDITGRLAPTPTTPTPTTTNASDFVRPFDPDATGTLAAEGGGVVILEEAAHAHARGTTPYAEVLGFGAAQSPPPFPVVDLSHTNHDTQTATDTNESPSDGLRYAIEAALHDAGISPADIDAIVPTAAGIPEPDATEAQALRAVFGDRLGEIPLVTIRPNLGDCQAGNGALQVAAACLCLREQKLPARLHAGTPAPGLDAGNAPARQATLGCMLVCSTSLGGQNAAVVLRHTPPKSPRPANT